VHLVGFIIRIYHNARSPERQSRVNGFLYSVHKLINTNGKTVVQKHKSLKQPNGTEHNERTR